MTQLFSSALLPAVHSISDGSLLASINLPAYLSFVAAEGDSSFLPSSLCLLQVSSDLSTAVAVSHSNTAVALDLNHYFRYRSWPSPVLLLHSRVRNSWFCQHVQQ